MKLSRIIKLTALLVIVIVTVLYFAFLPKGHVLISMDFKDESYRQGGVLGAFSRELEQVNIPINIYQAVRKQLKRPFRNYQVSGMGYETYKRVKDEIPSRYLWIHLKVVKTRSTGVHVNILTKGVYTSWSKKNVNFRYFQVLKPEELAKAFSKLPNFEVLRKESSTSSQGVFFNVKLMDEIRDSDSLE